MKVWTGKEKPPQYAHVKRDGWQVIVSVTRSGVKFWSKNFNPLSLEFLPEATHLNKLSNSLEIAGTINSYDKVELMCELWKPGSHASYISSGIANKDKQMRLDVFSVTKGLPAGLPLPETMVEVRRWGLDFIPFFDKENHPLSLGAWMQVHELFNPKLLAGVGLEVPDVEGFVLKRGNANTLGGGWKVKPFLSVDLVITDVSWGTKGKQHEGKVGALVCSCYLKEDEISGSPDNPLVEVANVSGMSVEDRDKMTRMFDSGDLMGKVIECKYQKLDSKGRLRHPTFVRFREDKDSWQCKGLG